MWRYFTRNNTYKYLDILQDIVLGYNITKCRTIGARPIDVNVDNQTEILQRAYLIPTSPIYHKFRVGDKVRISKVKLRFECGFEPNWSEECFIVVECLKRHPPIYRLKDTMNEEIQGIFYDHELQKVDKVDDVYVVEKVIQTCKMANGKKEYLVKWRGCGDKFNSWVSDRIKLLKAVNP